MNEKFEALTQGDAEAQSSSESLLGDSMPDLVAVRNAAVKPVKGFSECHVEDLIFCHKIDGLNSDGSKVLPWGTFSVGKDGTEKFVTKKGDTVTVDAEHGSSKVSGNVKDVSSYESANGDDHLTDVEFDSGVEINFGTHGIEEISHSGSSVSFIVRR